MTERRECEFGKWRVACIADDGGRIAVLQYDGYDLRLLRGISG